AVVAGARLVVVVCLRTLFGRRAGDELALGDRDHALVGGERQRRGVGGRRMRGARTRGTTGDREQDPGTHDYGVARCSAMAAARMRRNSGRYSGSAWSAA